MKKFHFSSIFAGGVENVHFLFPTAGILLYLSCEFLNSLSLALYAAFFPCISNTVLFTFKSLIRA